MSSRAVRVTWRQADVRHHLLQYSQGRKIPWRRWLSIASPAGASRHHSITIAFCRTHTGFPTKDATGNSSPVTGVAPSGPQKEFRDTSRSQPYILRLTPDAELLNRSDAAGEDFHCYMRKYNQLLTPSGIAYVSLAEQHLAVVEAAVVAQAASPKVVEDEEDDEDEEDTVADSATRTEEDKQKYRLRKAEDSLKFEKLLSKANIHKYVDMTEVSTPSGVRWVDIYGKSTLWANRTLARQSEGEFASAVLRAVYVDPIPVNLCTSLSKAGTLPNLFLEENWACLVLRAAKEVDLPEEGAAPNGHSATQSTVGVANRRHHPALKVPRHGRRPPNPKVTPRDQEHYDEDKNSYEELTDSSLRSILSRWWRSGGNSLELAQQRAAGASVPTAPVLTETTERLSILLFKELHPIEEDDPKGISATNLGMITKLDRIEKDGYASKAMRPASQESVEVPVDTAGRGAATASSLASSTDVVKERRYKLRWRILTIHRQRIPFIEDTLKRWGEFLEGGGRLLGEHERSNEFAINANAQSVDWEEIVRHLMHETSRGIQEANVHHTRVLENTEGAIFGDTARYSADQLRTMRQTLGDLHVLTRTMHMHTSILREMNVSYIKLKKEMNSPLNGADHKELLYLKSALSLAKSLEEQSHSLLVLQFSVAMNYMERNLRTLTVFTTFFIPLEVIVNSSSMDIASLESFYTDPRSAYVVFAMLIATALATSRWIRRNIQ